MYILPTGTTKSHHDPRRGAHEVNSTDSCQYHSGGHGGIRAARRSISGWFFRAVRGFVSRKNVLSSFFHPVQGSIVITRNKRLLPVYGLDSWIAA